VAVALTPVATRQATLTTRPASRAFIVTAARKVYGPASSGRVRTASTWALRVLGHHTDLRLRQSVDAELLDQLLHPPRRDSKQV
jgi:uncharacterized protein (DUF1778 family)